jgi:hypothetical protein
MALAFTESIARQVRECSARFLLRCNPYASEVFTAGFDEDLSYCEYLERLEKVEKANYRSAKRPAPRSLGYRWAIHQLMDLAEGLRLLDQWDAERHDARGAWYSAYRLDGSTHQYADMMAHQAPPGALTDREFLEGHCNGNQFEGQEWVGDQYKAMAAAEGVDTTGAVYINGLAAFAGDPKAWVRGRGDVARVCAERGYNADGAVTVRHGSREESPDIDVADDIIDQRVLKKLEADPGLAFRDPGEVRHEAKQEINPHWNKAAA